MDAINNDDLLSRAKKPQLITDYNAEIQVRAQLQSAATSCVPPVSHAAYTAAVDALAISLGGLSPAWNDVNQDTPLGAGGGATLRSRWSTIAQQRQALDNTIKQAVATKAGNDAISAAAADALNKANAAQMKTPTRGTFAYSAKPALPNGTYPAGSVWITTDGKQIQVSPGGNLWNDVIIAASALIDKIFASQVVIGGAGGALNADPMCRDIGSWVGPGLSISSIPWGRCGTTALCCSATGQPTVSSAERIPIDPSKTYRVSAWAIRDDNANGRLYVGLALQDGAGNNITGNGTYWYINAAATVLPLGSNWYHFSGTIGPAGSGADLAFTGFEKTANMLLLPNYDGTNNSPFYIQDFRLEEVIPGELIVDGGITTQKLSFTASSTTNFTQAVDDINGGVYASAGACMMTNTPSTPALIVDSAGFKIGKRMFTDYWFRLLNAIDGSYSGGVLVYRGNIDTSTRGGAPDINCLHLYAGSSYLDIEIRPSSTLAPGTDNIDSLRYLQLKLYPSSGGATPTRILRTSLPESRLYKANASSASDNSVWSHFGNASVGTSSTGYLRASIYNVYGPSAEKDFGPNSTAGGELPNVAVPNGGTPTGGGGGGGTGGGGCPAPWVPITLASGITVLAGALVDGMQVVGVDEATMEPAVGTVREPHLRWVSRVRIVLEDGREPEFTDSHRVAIVGGGWAEVRNLQPGMLLVAQRESRIKAIIPCGMGQVVSFTVDGCHTYFSDDILSHNAKILT